MRTVRIKMSKDEARCIGQVLSTIESKFKYDEQSERFVCSPDGSVMSLEFSGYAHLANIRRRVQEAVAKGGRR